MASVTAGLWAISSTATHSSSVARTRAMLASNSRLSRTCPTSRSMPALSSTFPASADTRGSSRAASTTRSTAPLSSSSLTTRSASRTAACSAARSARGQSPSGSTIVVSRTSARSEPVAHAAHREGARDVGQALHERPDAGEDDQRVGLVDEELAAGPEGEHEHEHAADEAQPPQRGHRALDERADRPPHADGQEQEAEDVGEPGEGLLRVDEGDDAADQEEHAEQRPQPAQRVGDRRDHQLLDAREGEHQADDDPDRRDRGLVELQDDQRPDDPGGADDEPEPPDRRDVTRGLARIGHADGGVAELR